jgi:hypothetical protein
VLDAVIAVIVLALLFTIVNDKLIDSQEKFRSEKDKNITGKIISLFITHYKFALN